MANQALDGPGNELFAVMAVAWMTDRRADPRRSGEARASVGSAPALDSAIGPPAADRLAGSIDYRNLSRVPAGGGASAWLAFGVPGLRAATRAVDSERIVLPFGMTVVITRLHLAGFFGPASERIAARLSGPWKLLDAVIVLSGVCSRRS